MLVLENCSGVSMLFCLINRLLGKFFHLGKLFSARANDTEKSILRVNTCSAAIGRGVCVKREHVVKGVILDTKTCELKHVLLHYVSDHVVCPWLERRAWFN